MKKKQLSDLRNSLRRRGFWVNVEEGELVLDHSFTKTNYEEMYSILMNTGLLVETGERGIRVHSDSSVPDKVLAQIETADQSVARRPNHSILLPKLSSFLLDHDLSVGELDFGIASLVYALNKADFITSMSCDGHGNRAPGIWFNGLHQMKELDNLLALVNQETSFAYDWKVQKETVGFVLTAKKRLKSDQWDVSKIQDDALAFSEFLLKSTLEKR